MQAAPTPPKLILKINITPPTYRPDIVLSSNSMDLTRDTDLIAHASGVSLSQLRRESGMPAIDPSQFSACQEAKDFLIPGLFLLNEPKVELIPKLLIRLQR